MTVKAVWGRIQRQMATLTAHEGDEWVFDVPAWAVSPIVVEIWAEDEAGNVSYKTGVFDIAPGETKCIRWREEGSSLLMLPEARPNIGMLDPGIGIDMLAEGRPLVGVSDGRPSVDMLAHACSQLVEVGI